MLPSSWRMGTGLRVCTQDLTQCLTAPCRPCRFHSTKIISARIATPSTARSGHSDASPWAAAWYTRALGFVVVVVDEVTK